MKRTTLLIIALILICSGNMGRKEAVANENTTKATIRIASTPDLYKLADKWSSEYGRLNPGINIGCSLHLASRGWTGCHRACYQFEQPVIRSNQ